MTKHEMLERQFAKINDRITALESRLSASSDAPLEITLMERISAVRDLLTAYAEHAGKPVPVTDDLLEVFKAFVKSDPSLNAVRDNVRELVYYRNCLDMDRPDALPAWPGRMAVRTARHIYLYLHTRFEQEARLS